MSLVVARVHDSGISVVGDTKITHYDLYPGHYLNRHVYHEKSTSPKLIILRKDVIVGLTGRNIDSAFPRLVDMRARSIDSLIRGMELLSDQLPVFFVVAALGPTRRLVEVRDGHAEDTTASGWAWGGEEDAWRHFRDREAESVIEEPGGRLASAMQWLLNLRPVESVGGHLTWAEAGYDGFRFVPGVQEIGPDFLEMFLSASSRGETIEFRVPVGGDPGSYSIATIVGDAPTVSSLAFYIPQTGKSLLFRHEEPWVPIPVRVDSVSELVRLAAREYRQTMHLTRFGDTGL